MASMASVAAVEADTTIMKTTYHPPRPRRFAPLNREKVKDAAGVPKLKGVIFDVDGTLCLPQNYMFTQMREALGIPKSVDILDHIRSLSDEPDQQSSSSTSRYPPMTSPQSRAVAAVQSIERTAMTTQTPQPGLVEIMTYLDSRQVLKGLCTRNFPAPVQHLIDTFLTPHGVSFAEREVITRDTEGVKPKPSPEGIWRIAQQWSSDHVLGTENAEPSVARRADDGEDVLDLAKKHLGSGLIMVGDSIDDMAAGYRAGAATVLLVNEYNQELAQHEYTDLAIERLDDLIEILDNGFVGDRK